jgi:hypothetical protein
MEARIHLCALLLSSLVSAQKLNKATPFLSADGLEVKNAASSFGMAVFEQQYRRLGETDSMVIQCPFVSQRLALNAKHVLPARTIHT